MLVGCFAQVLRREVDVDLGAGNLPVSQQVSQRHQVDVFLDQVRRKGVSQPVGRDALRDPCLPAVATHPLVDRVAREGSPAAKTAVRSPVP